MINNYPDLYRKQKPGANAPGFCFIGDSDQFCVINPEKYISP